MKTHDTIPAPPVESATPAEARARKARVEIERTLGDAMVRLSALSADSSDPIDKAEWNEAYGYAVGLRVALNTMLEWGVGCD